MIASLISPAEMFRLLLSSTPSIPLQLNVSFYLYLIPIHDIDCQGATYRLVHSVFKVIQNLADKSQT